MKVNAVRYGVFACSSKRKGRVDVLTGPVFSTTTQQADMSGREESEERHSFLVFLPTDVRFALRYQMGRPGQPDLERELGACGDGALCRCAWRANVRRRFFIQANTGSCLVRWPIAIGVGDWGIWQNRATRQAGF